MSVSKHFACHQFSSDLSGIESAGAKVGWAHVDSIAKRSNENWQINIRTWVPLAGTVWKHSLLLAMQRGWLRARPWQQEKEAQWPCQTTSTIPSSISQAVGWVICILILFFQNTKFLNTLEFNGMWLIGRFRALWKTEILFLKIQALGDALSGSWAVVNKDGVTMSLPVNLPQVGQVVAKGLRKETLSSLYPFKMLTTNH